MELTLVVPSCAVSYVIFVVTASKGIVDSPSLQKMDPFAIAFFVLPAGISGFYIVMTPFPSLKEGTPVQGLGLRGGFEWTPPGGCLWFV